MGLPSEVVFTDTVITVADAGGVPIIWLPTIVTASAATAADVRGREEMRIPALSAGAGLRLSGAQPAAACAQRPGLSRRAARGAPACTGPRARRPGSGPGSPR